jgi:hypothetical protein
MLVSAAAFTLIAAFYTSVPDEFLDSAAPDDRVLEEQSAAEAM